MSSTVVDRPTRWGVVGRYLGAVLACLTIWTAVLPDPPTENPSGRLVVLVTVDLVVGLLAIGLLPFRRRHPFGLAMVLSLALFLSSSVSGAWMVAAMSLGTRRRVLPSAIVILTASVASVVYEQWAPLAQEVPSEPAETWELAAVSLLVYTLFVGIGFYAGARRALLRSLRERAETAEREQISRSLQARAAERARIAREMHDVLAHRISTVAMHSGALAYRDDLSDEQVRATAHLIQENAHNALVELRDILGVLRGTESGPQASTPHVPEPPQPTLADLPTLVEDAVAAGQDVTLILDVDPSGVPDTLGRHVYRSVQECLTNARKHAPGSPVDVAITRERDDAGSALVMTVSNALTGRADRGLFARDEVRGGATGVPQSGVGLLGLAERADLAGGRLDHGPSDGRYLTRLTVPWPERSPS